MQFVWNIAAISCCSGGPIQTIRRVVGCYALGRLEGCIPALPSLEEPRLMYFGLPASRNRSGRCSGLLVLVEERRNPARDYAGVAMVCIGTTLDQQR